MIDAAVNVEWMLAASVLSSSASANWLGSFSSSRIGEVVEAPPLTKAR
jgi:hypothetical protein